VHGRAFAGALVAGLPDLSWSSRPSVASRSVAAATASGSRPEPAHTCPGRTICSRAGTRRREAGFGLAALAACDVGREPFELAPWPRCAARAGSVRPAAHDSRLPALDCGDRLSTVHSDEAGLGSRDDSSDAVRSDRARVEPV